MNFSIEANQAIEWTARLAAVYVLLDSAEKLYNFREFADDGILSWKFLRRHLFFSSRTSVLQNLFNLVFAFRIWLFLLFLRGVSGFYLLLFPQLNLTSFLCLGVLFAVGSLANLRNFPVGAETENRFSLIIIGALLLQSLNPTKFVSESALWFIALQACLSYTAAGFSKLFSSEWRKGNALFNSFNSPVLTASPKFAELLSRHEPAGKFLTWFNLIVECLFPLVLLVGSPFYIFFLIWGIVFHFSNAVLFRLNKFLWAWAAAYPAIIFAAQ